MLRTLSLEEKFDFLVDTRAVHNRLLKRYTPVGYEVYAGHYRGEPYPALETRRATFRYEHPIVGVKRIVHFTQPADVLSELQVLKNKIVDLRDANLDQLSHFAESVSIFRRFSLIHPYLNGNGRISRLMLALLADLKNIPISDQWRFHLRPYDNFIGFCFHHYQENPHFLIAYLARWFG